MAAWLRSKRLGVPPMINMRALSSSGINLEGTLGFDAGNGGTFPGVTKGDREEGGPEGFTGSLLSVRTFHPLWSSLEFGFY